MQQKMADYEQPAPKISWEQIELAVAANKRKAKIVPLWTRRVAAAAVVLLLAGAGYRALFTNKSDATENTPQMASQTPSQKTNSPQKDVSSQTPSQETTFPQTPEPRQLAQTAGRDSQETVAVADSPTKDETLTEQKADSQQGETKSPQSEKAEPKPEKVKPKPENQPKSFITQYQDFERKSKSHAFSMDENRLTAKFYFSNGMSEKGTDVAVVPQSPNATGPIGPPGDDEEPPKIYDNEYHRQPVRFGLSVNYRIADRWSIESGLVYTRHSSNYTYQPFDFFFVKAEQRLNYVGIPLKLNHLLWANRRFSVYASAGGMAEKMVNGDRKYMVHEDQPQVDEDVEIRPLQFSLNGAVGAAYRLTDLFSIYAQPELNYYFKNSNIDIPTFYQDKPLNFNFSVGLRMNFGVK